MQQYYVETYGEDEACYAGTHWYKDANCTIRHRVNGPAVEWPDGDKEWWVNGLRHREDGPAACLGNNKVWGIRTASDTVPMVLLLYERMVLRNGGLMTTI